MSNPTFLLQSVLILGAVLGYSYSLTLIYQRTRTPVQSVRKSSILTFLVIGLVLHGTALLIYPGLNTRLLTELGPAFSLTGLFSAIFYLLLILRRRSGALGLVVVPLAILGLIASIALPGSDGEIAVNPAKVTWHIALAIPTYAVLCLAFAQACLILVQEKQLKQPSQKEAFPGLPAMQSMETSLFWLTMIGFILMTLNLLSGMLSSIISAGTLLQFNHHIVLSIVAWATFGCLLLGRRIMGWRGEMAARWTIGAFLLLVLAYFGTRFVNDVILAA